MQLARQDTLFWADFTQSRSSTCSYLFLSCIWFGSISHHSSCWCLPYSERAPCELQPSRLRETVQLKVVQRTRKKEESQGQTQTCDHALW